MPRLSPNALTLLLLTSAAEAMLALYQWMELVLVRTGGTAICAINETVNCATVWNSGFAGRVQALAGMPVAGLGLVWGLTGFGLAVVLARRTAAGSDPTGPVAATKVWGLIGALSCVTFGVASMMAHAVCLTCLGTYALTVAFAAAAVVALPGGLPDPSSAFKPSAAWAGSMAVPIFLALLWPGSQTPKSTPTALADRPREEEVEKYFATLPWAEAQATADARAGWRTAVAPDLSKFPVHLRYGPPEAPVKLVEFTDILCAHCRALVGTLAALRKAVPADGLSIEPRYFPLDGECNHKVAQSSGDGVRCLGAKAQICLESSPNFWSLREELFEAQDGLTKEKIVSIASKGLSPDKLQECLASPATQARIDEDVGYAMLFSPKGTPLVLLNGKETMPVPSFLYGMVMGKGEVDGKYFAKLPPPR